jgi:tetratricopeptide (TPR) repeat protein
MKKIFFPITLFLFTIGAKGQTLENGRAMLRYQRYQSAQDVFTALLKTDPNDSLALYWKGQALLQGKEIPKAVEHYKTALAGKHSYLLSAGLAQALAAGNNKTAAQVSLGPAPSLPERIDNAVVAMAVARTYTEMKDFAKAEKFSQRATALQPANAEALVQSGNIALRMGNGSLAYTFFKKAIKADSSYLPAYFSLAKIYISQKASDMYMPLLGKIISQDSMYAPAWYELYRHAYFNDKSNVKKYYTKFLDLSDKTDQQETQLLVMDYNEKKYANVIARSTKLFADEDVQVSAEIYRYVAFSYYKINKPDEAYTNMVRYMQTQDSVKLSSYDRYLAAQLAARRKNMDSTALGFVEDAYERDTTMANKKFYAMSIVNHYVTSGDKYAATVWREKLLPLKGINMVDMYRIGVAWYEFNELDKAEKLFIQFNNLYPEEFKGVYMQAGIKAKIDSNMLAGVAVPYFEDFVGKASLNMATEYKPMLEQSYNYLGAYYLNKKDYGKALEYYSLLLKQKPTSADLKKTVAGLKKYIKEMDEYNNQAKNNKQQKPVEDKN